MEIAADKHLVGTDRLNTSWAATPHHQIDKKIMPRERYIFRGCLLLLAIIASIAIGVLNLISGELPDVLNRVGIAIEMVGVLAIVPDVIGEKRLEKIFSNIQGYKRAQQYIKEYLHNSQDKPNRAALPLFLFLDLTGNFLMCFTMIWLSIGVVFSSRTDNWIAIVLKISFGILGIEAATWVILLFVFVLFRTLANKMPRLFSYFLVINSFISALGVLFSAPLAFVIIQLLPLLIRIARVPMRKVIATVTLPFILLGASLQFIATFF